MTTLPLFSTVEPAAANWIGLGNFRELLHAVAPHAEVATGYGNYNFFRIGITPDGRWKFLSVGD